MKKIRIAPKTAYIQHPKDVDIRVKFRVPTRPEALAIQSEMAAFEKVRAIPDPFAPGKVLTDKDGKLITERYLEMPPGKLSDFLGRFIEGVEGLTVDVDGKEVPAWGNGFNAEDLMDPGLDYEENTPVRDAAGNPTYETDESGALVLDAHGQKTVKMRPVRKTYWQLVLEHYVNPELSEDVGAGKDSLTQSNG
jgi:hypothetical protein